MTMANHEWIPSTLGHGDAMCRFCKITHREAAAIGQWECLSVPVPAETGTHSPDNPPPGTVGVKGVLPHADDPSMVEQLARRLETYADDNDAMVSRRRLTITDAREMKSIAHTFRNAAKELREAMTDANRAAYQTDVLSIIDRYVDDRRQGGPADRERLARDIVKLFMG